MPTLWTKLEDETLRQLWSEGFSGSQISFRLGRSRNAVIGRVHRLNLPPHTLSCSVRKTVAKAPKRKPWKRFEFSRHPKATPIICEALPLPSPHETDIPRVSLQDAEQDACRWPCAEPEAASKYELLFCGKAKIPGLPYCEAHARRAFQPPPPRPREIALPAPAAVVPELEAA